MKEKSLRMLTLIKYFHKNSYKRALDNQKGYPWSVILHFPVEKNYCIFFFIWVLKYQWFWKSTLKVKIRMKANLGESNSVTISKPRLGFLWSELVKYYIQKIYWVQILNSQGISYVLTNTLIHQAMYQLDNWMV